MMEEAGPLEDDSEEEDTVMAPADKKVGNSCAKCLQIALPLAHEP